MNAVELSGTLPDGRPASVWACAECLRPMRSKEVADECCGPSVCGKCGAGVKRYHIICGPCGTEAWEAKRADAFEKAVKVSLAEYMKEEFDVVVLDGDEHSTSIGEWLDMDDEERPEHANAVKPRDMPQINARDMLGNELCEYHETAVDELDVDALQRLLDAWCAAQSVRWWVEDGRIVLLSGGTV